MDKAKNSKSSKKKNCETPKKLVDRVWSEVKNPKKKFCDHWLHMLATSENMIGVEAKKKLSRITQTDLGKCFKCEL